MQTEETTSKACGVSPRTVGMICSETHIVVAKA